MIEAAIQRLRAKIGEEPEMTPIRAVRGMGYVLEAPASTPAQGP